jgi:cell division initiation protein
VKLSPLDIQSQKFRVKMRGYDQREVEVFLDLAANEFEELIRENAKLKEKGARLSSLLEEFRERETTLKETMMTAQKVTEEMRSASRKEAELILADAEHKAGKLLDDAHRKAAKVADEIADLRRQRVQFEVQVRAAAEAHLKILQITSEAIAEESAKGDKVKRLVGKE